MYEIKQDAIESMTEIDGLAKEIRKLLESNPDRWITYEEIAELLGAGVDTVCTRCIELGKAGHLTKMRVESGRLRGRNIAVRFSEPPSYPTWLLPTLAPPKRRKPIGRVHYLWDEDAPDQMEVEEFAENILIFIDRMQCQ